MDILREAERIYKFNTLQDKRVTTVSHLLRHKDLLDHSLLLFTEVLDIMLD